MKKKRDLLLNRKIWSRRSSISPDFVDCSVRIYNEKTPVRCKITEGKVGHKFGEFAFTRKRRPKRTNIGPGKKRRGEKSSLSIEKLVYEILTGDVVIVALRMILIFFAFYLTFSNYLEFEFL